MPRALVAVLRAFVAVPRALIAVLVILASAPPADAAPAPIADWSGESIYMVMTDRFRNGDPSNDLDSDPTRPDWWHGGDLQGVIDELEYIKGLGMTAIWITPVAEQMPGGYHGYWTRDFVTVDPHLGTNAKLRELVQRAHAIGLKVILDVVLNHLGYGHPWLTDPARARSFHPECPINFADQRSVEMCWLAGLPDLDTEDPGVRTLLIEWSSYLIQTTGVDGFRVDAARHLSKEFLRAWTSAIRASHPGLWLLGEVYSSGYRYQSGFLDAGLDAVTDFQTYDVVRTGLSVPGNLAQLPLPPSLAAADLGAGRENARAIFIDSHDVPRFVGPDPPTPAVLARLRQALVYLFTMPGTPVLYYGTETALPGGPDPDDRRSMSWPAEGGDTALDVRRLATLRKELEVLRRGSFVELVAARQELAYGRLLDDEAIVVAFNGDVSASRSVRVALAALALGTDLAARAVFGPGPDLFTRDASLSIDLPPRGVGIWVVQRQHLAPVSDGWPLVAALALGAALAALAVAAVLRPRRRLR